MYEFDLVKAFQNRGCIPLLLCPAWLGPGSSRIGFCNSTRANHICALIGFLLVSEHRGLTMMLPPTCYGLVRAAFIVRDKT